MARVFKRNGTYYIDYVFEGRRKRTKIGSSKKAAQDALRVIEGEIVQKRYSPARFSNGRLFSEVAKKYWELRGSKLSKSYRYMYKEVCDRFGKRPIGTITPVDVERFYNEVAERSSNSTANRNLVFLGSIFNRAIEWDDFFGRNPCQVVKKRREPEHRTRFLTHEEMTRLMRACHPRLYPVVVCALTTGMRSQEILGLRWENVKLDGGFITVTKTKNGKSRHVPICKRLRGVLETLGPKESGSVFNLPFIMRRRYFDRALKETGIVGFRFHDLRHTFASWYAMRTLDLAALKEVLGHGTIQLTTRYAHLAKGHMASNISTFETAIPLEGEIVADSDNPPVAPPPDIVLLDGPKMAPEKTGDIETA